jgi:HD-GYP domain-containing protein (c-di-GMP phosphodiesterase class II)
MSQQESKKETLEVRPQGDMAGVEVHPYARVCGLVDAFDALTTRRSYKPALTQFEALGVMKDKMYVQFDPEIFKTFVLLCQRKG